MRKSNMKYFCFFYWFQKRTQKGATFFMIFLLGIHKPFILMKNYNFLVFFCLNINFGLYARFITLKHS